MIFENVGGEIFKTILAQINTFARIALCGFISEYNATEVVPGPNLGRVLVQRAKMQGFIVLDYQPRAMEAIMPLAQWLGEGKIKYRTHVVDGLENAPTAINMLFDGSNQGKLLIQVSEL